MTQQRDRTWSDRRCITALLTWGLIAMTHGQCDLSALHGQQFFDGYTPSGGVILRQYNDVTDTIVITVDGAVQETMHCVQHGSWSGRFTSYVFTKEVNNETVYPCVKQYYTRRSLYFWQTPTYSYIHVGSCFIELGAKPVDALFSIEYPFTQLDLRSCYAPVGLYHAVIDSTTSCEDDVSSFVQSHSTWFYTRTCSATDTSYEYPHQANFSCHYELRQYYLGGPYAKSFTIVSITFNGRKEFYCMSIKRTNGQRAIQLLPQPETLNCSGDPSLTIFLLADQCDLGVCQNGGSCSQTPDTYYCHCADGFAGHDCSVVDGCLSDPCMNGATCSSDVNGYSCLCPSGYGGMRCETDVNECASGPCQNRATCVDDLDGYTCICKLGYEGARCETDINECASRPCLNRATCLNNINSFSCLCKPGYQGITCETDIDECASDPCLNRGTCVDDVNAFRCICQPGYDGIYCQNDKDECSSRPCLNDGVCVDMVNDYACVCDGTGYSGDTCYDEIDECASNPCENDQQCVNLVNSFLCRRQPDIAAADPCASIPCDNNARCVTVDNSFSCLCPPGFSGVLCSNENDHMSFTVSVVLFSILFFVCLLIIIIVVCVLKKMLESISAAKGVCNTGASTEDYENMVRRPDEGASDAYTMIRVGDSGGNRDSSLPTNRSEADYAEPTL